MSVTQIVAELTEICARQADIIRGLFYLLEQFGETAGREEAAALQERLRRLTGEGEATA